MSSSSLHNDCSSNSFKNSFLNEWTLLFGKDISFDEIRQHCFEGKLRDSRLRSVIWRVLLKVLPLDRQEWRTILEHTRKTYESLKFKFNTNPRLSSGEPDFNNPLSLQNENPWQQFFLDEELRECINKDVERTFPDLQFFQSAKTKEIMSNVLFVYSKLNPHISYRQGMHELLAAIIFAIYFDHRSFEHLSEQNCLDELNKFDVATLKTLNDPKYLEHDSFALFQQLVMLLEGWFITDSEFESSSPSTADEMELFANKDNAPNSELLRRLDYINEELLSKVDPILYRHLKSLDISVHIFGLRWLRLLFMREFHLHDLLFVWDVVLADRPTLNLVDYVFLALLIQIRDYLLSSDYSGTIQYLLRYPPIADIHSFIKLVLHLKFPKTHPRPKNCGLPLYSHMTLAGTAHPNQNRELTKSAPPTNGLPKKPPVKKPKPVDILLNKLGRSALAASPPNNRDFFIHSAMEKQQMIKSRVQAHARSQFYVPVETETNIQQMQSHIFDLQSRTRHAVQRLTRASDHLEQQNLPQQGPIIIELREIASLLNEGIVEEAEMAIDDPPVQVQSRSNSLSMKVDKLQPRSNSLSMKMGENGQRKPPAVNGQELVEMNFQKKKNF